MMDCDTPITVLSLPDVVTTIGNHALVNVQAGSQLIVLALFVPKLADPTGP